MGLGEFVEGIELFGGKMVRVDGGVIKNLSNIKEPKNWLKIRINELQIKAAAGGGSSIK